MAKQDRTGHVAEGHGSPQGSAPALSGLRWRKSTSSGPHECVFVATTRDEVGVRNSNDPLAETLWFGRREMGAWIEGVKAGEFDYLAE
jgi:hypothetical protein